MSEENTVVAKPTVYYAQTPAEYYAAKAAKSVSEEA